MGTWICHLRIADRLLAAIPGLDETAFIYGNLAPDSGIPNETWTEFDPPKEVTHYLRKGEGESEIHDLTFYREYVSPLSAQDGLTRYSFIFGYHCHLVCDTLWAKCIGHATHKIYAEEIAADKYKAWDRIKDDWYGLDQIYLRDHPENAFWRVVAVTPDPPSYLPFIKKAALSQQLDHIRKFYGQPDAQWFIQRPYPYLNEGTMTRMVNQIIEAILYLQPKLKNILELDSYKSSADILPEKWIRPFQAPLGDN